MSANNEICGSVMRHRRFRATTAMRDYGIGDLVVLARQGDRNAFDELARRIQPTIAACARQCGLGPASADDLKQETLLALYRHLAAIRNAEAVNGWVRTTARRIAWGLKQSDHIDVARLDRMLPCVVGPNSPEDDVVAATESERIRTAFAGLPSRDREVLALTVMPDEPRPYDEIAAELGCAVGSVGPFRMRSLDHLDRALRINARSPHGASRARHGLTSSAVAV
jgi:RNA polymerase sigma factor (sigma-70 family)